MLNDTSKRQFLREVWARWKATVTGSHSAPFYLLGLPATVVATIVSAKSSDSLGIVIALSLIVPFLLIYSSLFYSFHAVWQDERTARIIAEEKLNPIGLELSFDGSSAVGKNVIGEMIHEYFIRVKNNAGKPIDRCIIQVINTNKYGDERGNQVCAPFSLLVDECRDEYVIEHNAFGNGHVLLPVFWKKIDDDWIKEPGGMGVSNGQTMIFEALSSETKAARIMIKASVEDGRWMFRTLS